MLQKKDRELAIVWLLFLLMQPLAVSMAMGWVTDWTQSNAVEYNVTDAYDGATHHTLLRTYNVSGNYYEGQTLAYDNTTKTVIVPSMLHKEVIAPTRSYVQFYMNTTVVGVADLAITRITIAYNYVGTGNITGYKLQKILPTPIIAFVTSLTTTVFTNNGTITFVPEVFQQSQLKTVTTFRIEIIFADDGNLPSDGDYIEIAVNFYTSSLIMSSDNILKGIALAFLFIDGIGCLAITGIWNPKKNSG